MRLCSIEFHIYKFCCQYGYSQLTRGFSGVYCALLFICRIVTCLYQYYSKNQYYSNSNTVKETLKFGLFFNILQVINFLRGDNNSSIISHGGYEQGSEVRVCLPWVPEAFVARANFSVSYESTLGPG